jgi:ABC-type Co2+ transport system permease subunit
MIKVWRKLSRPATALWTILCLYGPLIRIVSTAQIHTNPNNPLIKRRNSSETMTYLTLVALMMFVLSPVLVPLVITAVHTIGDLRAA